MHNLMMGKKQVQFAAEVEVFEPNNDQERDVNFVGYQRFGNSQGVDRYQPPVSIDTRHGNYNGGSPRGNYSGNQSSSNYNQKPFQSSGNFIRNYGSSSYQNIPPPTSTSKMESMLEQLLEGQEKTTVDLNGKIDVLYTDLNGKIEQLNTYVKKLDTQVEQTAEAVKRQDNTHPGKIDANPRYACNAIVLNGDISGDDFEKICEEFLAMISEEVEDEDVVFPEPVSIDTTHQCRSTPATMIDTTNQCRSIPLISVDRHPSQTDPEGAKTPKSAAERVYKPIPPYPRATNEYKALVEKISQKCPAVKVYRDLPCVKEILDKAYAEEICLSDAVKLIYSECASILHSRLPEKLTDPGNTPTPSLKQLTKREDPGKFSVPCSISGVEFKESLVDSGSSVNVMSREIAERLRIGIEPAVMTLTFANDATSLPYGIILNLLIKVGDCLVPTDFQVVEMSERSSTPLILGRPFMATAGAVIDTPSKRISFSYIDKEISYKAIHSRRAPKLISCITADVVDEAKHLNDTAAGCVRFMDAEKQVLKLVSVDRRSPPVSIDTRRRITQKVKQRNKPKSDMVFTSSHITLTPQRRVGDAIEYKVKCKGMSKPFSKVKALITPELKAQGQAALDYALSKVLKLNMHDHMVRGPRLNPPPPLPDPSSDPHHL
ncbi:hypothetical protein V5N11_001848 [Cardamine amara subsp. amara]|uniref:Aspartic peptidase DDI1-type domain-containing protein n=1 Tax=Cardamine amara subsp. amara TaxID=228776 RepID=A0ABD1BL79_CARAN